MIIELSNTSVLDTKLLAMDPDPQIENQEFRIRILDPESNLDPGSGSFCKLETVKFLANMKTQMD